MFAKAMVLIAFLTLLGAATLHYRQRRLETTHQMTTLHRQIHRDQRQLWDLQTRLAQETAPDKLTDRMERANVILEPTLPSPPRPVAPSMASIDSERDRW